MQFYIEEFYPFISKGFLIEAIDHAQSLVNINKEEIKTIMHSCKSLLFNNTSVWIKREGDPDFGSFDDVEICELVGVYILNVLGEKYGKERVGLYRDNGLACFDNIVDHKLKRLEKMLLRSLSKNSTSILLVKQTSKLSIF